MEPARSHRLAQAIPHARRRLESGHERGKHGRLPGAKFFPERQGRRPERATGVRVARHIGIVEIQAMRQRPVAKRSHRRTRLPAQQ